MTGEIRTFPLSELLVLTLYPSATGGGRPRRSMGPRLFITLCVAVAGHLGNVSPIAAQWAESSLLRSGQISVFIAPFMTSYDERYGLTADGSEPIEPLGADFTESMLGVNVLPAVIRPQERFASLLQDSALVLNLGNAQTRALTSVARIPVGASIGVFDWLTIGGVAPFVKHRIELDFLIDPEAANTGMSPGASGQEVLLFLGQATTALTAVTAQVDATCASAGATAPACLSGRAFLTDASSFFGELQTAYGGPLFLFGQGNAADALNARVDAYRTQMHALAASAGIDTTFTALVPYATGPLSVDQYQTFISNGAWGIGGDPLVPQESLWELGDVEVFAALRLLGSGLDPAEARDRARQRARTGDSTRTIESNVGYLLGVKGTYRLGTGRPARPTSQLDVGSGDGLDDVEVEVFGHLDYGSRLRARFEAVYGLQLEGDITNRVYERDQPFASFLTHMPRRVDPGDYRSLTIAPEIRLTPEVSIGGRYRTFHKARDSYDPSTVSEMDAELLTIESEVNLSHWGVGVSFWPSSRSAAKGAWPVAITAEYLSPAGGSGGQAPRGSQLRIQLRLFFQAW